MLLPTRSPSGHTPSFGKPFSLTLLLILTFQA